MYRRPKFLEILHSIREEMSREVDYDVDLFAQMLRNESKKQLPGEIALDLRPLDLDSPANKGDDRTRTGK